MINSKNYNLENLLNKIESLKDLQNYVGFTNGCFDLLHEGHIFLLNEAKKKCDFLIVALNSDKSIKLLKGECRPIDIEKKRIAKLSSLESVDAIIVFTERTPYKLINKINPNILFKGSDYKVEDISGSELVMNNGGKVELINILSGYSTTNIINNSNKS